METVFTQVTYSLGTLVSEIEMGSLGLPDIQRPFVWEAAKVRDLFDSMYRGYPVGQFLFWESGALPGAKQIGTDGKQLAPSRVIVDGQQRLTSLFAVMTRRQVIGKDFKPKTIRIAFRPRDGFFSVPDATTDNNPEFLNDIGEIWTGSQFATISYFLANLKAARPDEEVDENQLSTALSRVAELKGYQFTALVLKADIEEKQVAEVFVRINSKGKNLNAADFILTLMSVYWDQGRFALEDWSRDCHTPGDPAWNQFISPEPSQLLRVSIALGFRRAQLQDVYSVLRGRDPRTGNDSEDVRTEQFARLEAAQARVLDKQVWKEYLQCLGRAGNQSSATVSSPNSVMYVYAIYLIGKHDYGVPLKQLREVIARWFFMVGLTGRYTGSAESTVERDLGALPTETTAAAFVSHLDRIIAQQLTDDFWTITLPADLTTSASRSPALFGYIAALNILKAPVLFSKMLCSELLDPVAAAGSSKLQRHHLFPKKFLEKLGIVDVKQVNQIANLALLEWYDNIAISADDPSEYWPEYLSAMREPPAGMAKFSEAEIANMLHAHGLWEDWPALDYEDFLETRRKRMAVVVRDAFARLSAGEADEVVAQTWPPSEAAIQHILGQGETAHVEMKSSLRADTAGRGVPPRVLEKVVARTVAGFMNQRGGVLVIGADDDGNVVGLDADIATLQRKDLDGFQQALVQVITTFLGTDVAASVRIHIAPLDLAGKHLALVECPAYPQPVYLADGGTPELHVRAGNTTRLMNVEEAAAYVGIHWQSSAVAIAS